MLCTKVTFRFFEECFRGETRVRLIEYLNRILIRARNRRDACTFQTPPATSLFTPLLDQYSRSLPALIQYEVVCESRMISEGLEAARATTEPIRVQQVSVLVDEAWLAWILFWGIGPPGSDLGGTTTDALRTWHL